MVSTNLPSLKMELKVYETFTRVASALRLDTWYLILDTWYFTIWFETWTSVGGCSKRPIIDIGKKLVQSFPPSAAVAWGSSQCSASGILSTQKLWNLELRGEYILQKVLRGEYILQKVLRGEHILQNVFHLLQLRRSSYSPADECSASRIFINPKTVKLRGEYIL